MRRAAIYTRISSDREDRRLGVTRQEQACRDLAQRLGWTVVDVYEDNDTSASTGRDRPAYDRMIRDAEAGLVDAIVVLNVDRLTRVLVQFAGFLRWCDNHQIAFATTEGDNTETSNGRFILKIKATMAETEAEKISERVRAAVSQRARSGGFHGGQPPFGHEAVWATINGKRRVVEFKIHPERAAWVREAADRILAGESLYGICRDWNAKGRRTPTGGPWMSSTLRRALVKPSIIGMRDHGGDLHPAPWEGLIAEEQWQRICTRLMDPARRNNPDSHRRYSLSGLVYCALCGCRLHSMSEKRSNGPSYACAPTSGEPDACMKIRITMGSLEQFIVTGLFEYADTVNDEIEPPSDDTERELIAAIDSDTVALQELEDEKDDRKLDPVSYTRRRNRLESRLAANEAQLRAITRRPPKRPSGNDLRSQWDERDDVWKRTMLGLFIQRIDVGPHPLNPATGRPYTSAPPRRRGEDEAAWRKRFDLARAHTIARRIKITWLV